MLSPQTPTVSIGLRHFEVYILPWTMALFLCSFFRRAGGSLIGLFASAFLWRGSLGRFRSFPLLVAAVMKLLVGRLFLHASIMSQIRAISWLTSPGAGRL
jgi:hypothetical protein